jgi:hypothetical protein
MLTSPSFLNPSLLSPLSSLLSPLSSLLSPLSSLLSPLSSLLSPLSSLLFPACGLNQIRGEELLQWISIQQHFCKLDISTKALEIFSSLCKPTTPVWKEKRRQKNFRDWFFPSDSRIDFSFVFWIGINFFQLIFV